MEDVLKPLIKPEFARPRTEDDPDLVSEVHKRLSSAGWKQADTWLGEEEIVKAKDAPPELQRFLISRNLQARFCGLAQDTRVERLVLNAQSPLEEYLGNVEQYVAPGLVKLQGEA